MARVNVRLINNTERAKDLEERLDKLAALGSPDQIAGFFEEQGVYGGANGSNCPVARYLTRETGRAHSVTMGNTMQWRPGSVSPETAWARNPEAVTSFIVRFDNDCYPQLRDVTEE